MTSEALSLLSFHAEPRRLAGGIFSSAEACLAWKHRHGIDHGQAVSIPLLGPAAKADGVWIVHETSHAASSAAFTDRTSAQHWCHSGRRSGLLTWYPLDEGAYDWAVRHGFFKPKPGRTHDGHFVARFSSAGPMHFHVEDGEFAG